MNNIERILQEDNKVILKLILEQMETWKISRMRHKLAPHWADDKYGNWSHKDRLFNQVFGKQFPMNMEVREQLTGDRSFADVHHVRCRLCKKDIICDRDYSDGRYSHLFASCPVTSNAMKNTSSEEEFRKLISKLLEGETNNEHNS